MCGYWNSYRYRYRYRYRHVGNDNGILNNIKYFYLNKIELISYLLNMKVKYNFKSK